MKKAFVVGIAGGSGSGKTTLAAGLLKAFGSERACIIYQDSYYYDQSKNFDRDGGQVNFDHPHSLEFSLLAEHLKLLKEGKSIDVPTYDFKTHSRLKSSQHFEPRALVILDGILILSQPQIVENLDFSVFVDTSEKLRFERRLHRDVSERGRTEEGVRAQFKNQVKPMHDLFVEPSKAQAQLVVSGETKPDLLIDQVSREIEKRLL